MLACICDKCKTRFKAFASFQKQRNRLEAQRPALRQLFAGAARAAKEKTDRLQKKLEEGSL